MTYVDNICLLLHPNKLSATPAIKYLHNFVSPKFFKSLPFLNFSIFQLPLAERGVHGMLH